MPTLSDVVTRTLAIRATTDGVDKATESMKSLADAYGGVAVASDSVTKSTTGTATQINRLQGQLDPAYRAATQLNAAQTLLGKSFDQGLISVDRYNQLMALASQRFDDAGKKASPFSTALSGVKTQMIALSAGLGPVGTGLAAFGPIGLAAAVAVDLVAKAFGDLKDQANEAGQWATTLTQSAAIIGLNTTQIQALNEAAAQVGVSANDNVSAFEKFSVALGQLKDGSGTLYTELLKVNPQLVNQLSVTKDSTTAWNLLAQAYASANAQQQALITRAAFGRGGASEGLVLQATANAGGINGLDTSDAVSKQQIAQWSQLTTQINSATEAAQHNFQTIFTSQILSGEKDFADGMLSISQSAKEFALSNDLKTFIGFITNPILAGILGGAAVGAAGGAFFGGIGAIPGALAGGFAGGVAGATVEGVSALGASNRAAAAAQSPSAVPPAPNFNADFSAVTVASIGVQSAQAQQQVSLLGSVATATDKYNAAVLKLNAEVARYPYLAGLQGRALDGLKLDRNIAQQSTQNKSLGASPSASEMLETAKPHPQLFQSRTIAGTNSRDNQDDPKNVRDKYHLPAAA